MKVRSHNYWVSGPPIGIFDSLVTSGLIGSAAELPKQSKTPKINFELDKNDEPRSTKPKPVTRAQSRAHITVQPSVEKRNITTAVKKNPINPVLRCVSHTTSPKTTVINPRPLNIEEVIENRKAISQQNSECFHDFPDIVKQERGHINRKETIELSNNFRKKIEEIEETFSGKELTTEEQFEKRKQLLAAYYLLWNETILLTKQYNADLALMGRNIKEFIHCYIDDYPLLIQSLEDKIAGYVNQLDVVNMENAEMRTTINNMQKNIDEMAAKIDKDQEEINNYKEKVINAKKEVDDYLYKMEDQKGKTDEIRFKVGKVEEKNRSLLETIDQLNGLINNQQEALTAQEEKIEVYERDGAGFKPMYTEELKKNEKLQAKIEELEKEIVVLKTPTPKSDAETSPIPELMIKVCMNKKKQRKGSLMPKVTGSFSPFTEEPISFSMENLQDSRITPEKNKKTVSPSPSGKNLKPARHASISRLTVDSLDMPHMKSSENPLITPKDSIPLVPTIHEEVLETPKKVKGDAIIQPSPLIIPKDEITPAKTYATLNKYKEDAQSKSLPLKASISRYKSSSLESDFTASNARLCLSRKENDVNFELLPKDYRKNNEIEIPGQIKTFVNCLLPMPVNPPTEQINEAITNPKEGFSLKPFVWTLRQIVYIFKNGLDTHLNNTQVSNTNLLTIIQNVISSSTENTKVRSRITIDFFYSINNIQTNCDAARFFSSFISGEYTMVDFQFFNVVFNLVFDSIYPSFNDAINDPDLRSEVNYFYIHEGFAKKIIAVLLRDNLVEEVEEKFNKIRHPKYPLLIKFWDFATILIDLFREIHQMFHNQAKTVLFITGYSQNDCLITEQRFYEFMHIISPFQPKEDVASLWNSLCLANTNANDGEITVNSFLKFCGNFPDLSNAIFNIQCVKDFQKLVRSIPSPLVPVYDFMRKRYNDVLPLFYNSVTGKLKKSLKDAIVKIRNSFIKCDLSSCLTQYSHIIQLIDLKLSEEYPYIVFSEAVGSEEVRYELNMVMMRECLASNRLSIKMDTSPNSLLAEQRQREKL